jgi:hypothetical protein
VRPLSSDLTQPRAPPHTPYDTLASPTRVRTPLQANVAIRPSTPPWDRRDAYVRWNKVCAAEASTPVRRVFCAEIVWWRQSSDATQG